MQALILAYQPEANSLSIPMSDKQLRPRFCEGRRKNLSISPWHLLCLCRRGPGHRTRVERGRVETKTPRARGYRPLIDCSAEPYRPRHRAGIGTFAASPGCRALRRTRSLHASLDMLGGTIVLRARSDQYYYRGGVRRWMEPPAATGHSPHGVMWLLLPDHETKRCAGELVCLTQLILQIFQI